MWSWCPAGRADVDAHQVSRRVEAIDRPDHRHPFAAMPGHVLRPKRQQPDPTGQFGGNARLGGRRVGLGEGGERLGLPKQVAVRQRFRGFSATRSTTNLACARAGDNEDASATDVANRTGKVKRPGRTK